MNKKHLTALISSFVLLVLAGCTHPLPSEQTTARGAPKSDFFTRTDANLSSPFVFVIYGDMRFTDPTETEATAPGPRRALVEKIAAERPGALLLTGDVPWHGGTQDDYRVYRDETAVWRERAIPVYPVLGNHEFAQCQEAACLENWWNAFPQLRGQRWYSVALGTKLRVLALDSNASLLPDSEQGRWLERQVDSLPDSVRFVVITLHHPPLTDSERAARANEQALSTFLSSAARQSAARFVVCAGHVHNYERFERDGIVYLVSGGGGAKPAAVSRSDADFYKDAGFPNFHYLRFELDGERLKAEMIKLTDYSAPAPGTWAVKDRFEVVATLRPKN